MSNYKLGLTVPVRGAAFEKQSYQRGATLRVGAVLFHGNSDRDTAAAQLNTQLIAIASAVVSAAGGDPSLLHTQTSDALEAVHNDSQWAQRVLASRDALVSSPYLELWDGAVSPIFNEWSTFYNDRTHWYDAMTEAFTSWEDYQTWFGRINDLRDQVEGAGIVVQMPRMRALHKSVQEGAENALVGVANLLKNVVYVLLALAGGYLLLKLSGTKAVGTGVAP